MNFDKSCPICNGREFAFKEILWSELIEEWELQTHEVEYINRQQGLSCTTCGNNLRSMALADAIMRIYQCKGTLNEFVCSEIAQPLKVLEINEAGGLSPYLEKLPGHVFINYPEYDMTKVPFESGSFDLVVHSDTLEHVADPVAGLSECRRILNTGGACVFTVPIVIGRLSRSRKGLKDSYHGDEKNLASDLLVQTEFGSDAWEFALKAGFRSVSIYSFEYPSAITLNAIAD